MSGGPCFSPYLSSGRNETGCHGRGQRMNRMALGAIIVAGCFILALTMADAAQKMRPPLPKPKPAEIAAPEPEPAEVPASESESSEPLSHNEAGPTIVIPREKPAELQKPAAQVALLPAR